jgi:hypothetical protein
LGLLLVAAGRPALAFSCEVAADQKSLTLRADNPAGTEKTCSVSCEVETVDGAIGTAMCSGVLVPAGAKGYELCVKTRDEPFYKSAKLTESDCE